MGLSDKRAMPAFAARHPSSPAAGVVASEKLPTARPFYPCRAAGGRENSSATYERNCHEF
jgi:hypothetical protein